MAPVIAYGRLPASAIGAPLESAVRSAPHVEAVGAGELATQDLDHVGVRLDRGDPRAGAEQLAGQRPEPRPELHGDLVRPRRERLDDALHGVAGHEEALAEAPLGGEPVPPQHPPRVLPVGQAHAARRRVARCADTTIKAGLSSAVADRTGTPNATSARFAVS